MEGPKRTTRSDQRARAFFFITSGSIRPGVVFIDTSTDANKNRSLELRGMINKRSEVTSEYCVHSNGLALAELGNYFCLCGGEQT